MEQQLRPHIDQTSFGWITVEGEPFNHDIYIDLRGHVQKRKKRLSKEIYGTSHNISKPEAEAIFEHGTDAIIIGCGQYGMAKLSDEADRFFRDNHCNISLLSTPQAIKAWNEAKGHVIGLFHITC